MATAQRPPVFSPPQGPLPNFALPPISNLELNDTALFAVYCFIRNFVGVTTCASSVIDHKIEQAMDLVKTHLMNSMRAEVESLKARIAELMERIHQLELENDFLKANASPEVLSALNNGAASRIQDTALSYDFMTPTTTQSATN